jgi:hypothetical protein
VFSASAKRLLSSTEPSELIPVPLFPHEENNEGKIVLHIPKFKNQRLGRFFLSKKTHPYFPVDLDSYGSRVYRHLNGENTIEQILQLIQNDGKEPIEQLETRSYNFIQQLFNFKYITFKQLT